MRISLDEIEEIRLDPDAYREAVEAGQECYRRTGRHAVMQNALVKLHRSELTAAEARDVIITKCKERFKDNSGLSPLLRRYDQYVASYNALNTETPLAGTLVSVLMPSGVDPRFKITGTVRRMDRHKDGTYTAWLFERSLADWQTQLKLPLIADALVAKLNLNYEDLEIGIYCFQDSSSQTFSFTEVQIESAQSELASLLMNLSSLVQNEPLPDQTVLDLWSPSAES
jgi:hypothetical protein